MVYGCILFWQFYSSASSLCFECAIHASARAHQKNVKFKHLHAHKKEVCNSCVRTRIKRPHWTPSFATRSEIRPLLFSCIFAVTGREIVRTNNTTPTQNYLSMLTHSPSSHSRPLLQEFYQQTFLKNKNIQKKICAVLLKPQYIIQHSYVFLLCLHFVMLQTKEKERK